MDYLFTIAIGLLVFFLFSLIRKPEKDTSDYIFIAWIILLVTNEVGFLLYSQSKLVQYARIITFSYDALILHVPMLYLYAKAFSQAEFTLKKKHLLHFSVILLPIITRYIISSISLYSYDINRLDINLNSTYNNLSYAYKYVITGIYLYASFKVITQHQRTVKSTKDAYRNLWLKQLFNGITFVVVSIICIQLLRIFFPVALYDRMAITAAFTSLFIFPAMYLANSQMIMFNHKAEKTKPQAIERYTTSTSEEQTIVDTLTTYLEKSEAYLDSKLTIKGVADALDIPQRTLSQSINKVTQNTFIYLVNTYRVERMKKMLKDETKRQYTILTLAEESGFSSKSTLVRIFKQHTDMTPSEYLAQLNG